MRSGVAQHLPSSVQHDLVALLFARTIEAQYLQGYRVYHHRRRRERPWHPTLLVLPA